MKNSCLMYLLVVAAGLACLGALFADQWLSPLSASGPDFSVKVLRIDMVPGAIPLSLDVGNLKARAFSFSFDALAIDDHYENYFQTADERAIGLELQHPGQLHLRAFDAYLKIDTPIELNRFYSMRVEGGMDRSLEVYIDGTLALRVDDPEITSRSVSFSNVLIGSGFGDQRRFQGEIRNLDVRLTGTTPAWAEPFLVMVGVIGAIVLGALCVSLASSGKTQETDSVRFAVGTPLIAGALFVTVVGIALTIGAPSTDIGKWLGPVAALILIALAVVLVLRFPAYALSTRWAALLATIVVSVLYYALWSNVDSLYVSWERTSFWCAVLSLMATLVFTLARWKLERNIRLSLSARVWTAFPLFAGLFVVFLAHSYLQNWNLIAIATEERPIAGTLFALIGTTLAVLVVVSALDGSRPASRSTKPWLQRLLSLVPYVFFAFLALRVDMLFTGSSELHWEYFVGVVRAVHNGGWLLHDTPSQYGSFGLLLAAWLPLQSAWDAFFVIHGIVLMSAAALLYSAAHRYCDVPKWLALLLSTFVVFFAYPGLFQPTPYPSSGPMRFIWVYGLMYCACSAFTVQGRGIKRYARVGAVLWTAGVAWSAESAIYSTAIYFAPLALHVLNVLVLPAAGANRAGLFRALSLFAPAAGLFSAVLGALCIHYLWRLGTLPDWSMHFMYGFAYAAGFGGYPVLPTGPIWLYVLPMALSVVSLFQFDRNNEQSVSNTYLTIAASACL